MFNRQPFNRGKFNVSNAQSSGSNGIALMIMGVKPTLVEKVISAKGITNMLLQANSNATKVKYNKGITDMILEVAGEGTKVFIVSSDISDMTLETNANQTLAGEATIMLENINLKVGDELVINTCDMTVTVNGQNAMKFFDSESEFMSLLNGLNTIIYSDTNSNRKISLDVIWKDRWL